MRSNEIIVVNAQRSMHIALQSICKYFGFSAMPFLIIKQIEMKKDANTKWNVRNGVSVGDEAQHWSEKNQH